MLSLGGRGVVGRKCRGCCSRLKRWGSCTGGEGSVSDFVPKWGRRLRGWNHTWWECFWVTVTRRQVGPFVFFIFVLVLTCTSSPSLGPSGWSQHINPYQLRIVIAPVCCSLGRGFDEKWTLGVLNVPSCFFFSFLLSFCYVTFLTRNVGHDGVQDVSMN